MTQRVYACIDLKSFYASVECVERHLDPLTTHLVVADPDRTEKTICLAVSPALKAYGIPGRARLFEVIQRVKEVNAARQRHAPRHCLNGEATDANKLLAYPDQALAYITAPPRMALYMRYSAEIYQIYLKYIAPEDIHVYSVDEVFIDLTDYIKTYGLTARELVRKLIAHVFSATGITATAGVGTNLYLAKIAMDIMAKHTEPDEHGGRIAVLDEADYRRQLWSHRPLTDFWRIGTGYAKMLEANGLYTMGDVARCSLGAATTYKNEELLYRLFGVNAELLIDHAWGWEPCTIAEIKAYKPTSNSISSGQVLQNPYSYEKARLIVREMAEQLSLDLADKGLVADQVVLTVGYDVESLTNPQISRFYQGEITTDHYGRQIPRNAHGSANLGRRTASTRLITQSVLALYERIMNQKLLVRRITLAANHVVIAANAPLPDKPPEQLELFRDYAAEEKKQEEEAAALEREQRMQQAMLAIRKKFGKNAIVKAADLQEGATALQRNKQIGGHKE